MGSIWARNRNLTFKPIQILMTSRKALNDNERMSSQYPEAVYLRDGTKIMVDGLPDNLIDHLICVHGYDDLAIDSELRYVMSQLDKFSNDGGDLLKKCFHALLVDRVELTKKIKGPNKNRDRANIPQTTYSIADNISDIKRVLHLRKQVFVGEEGYPNSAIINGFERGSLHVMAQQDGELVGVVTVSFDSPKGLPLDKYLDLSSYKGKQNVEIDKLAVLRGSRKKELSFQLMWICYSIAKFGGAEKLFIFTLRKKNENIDIYRRFGFSEIGEFKLFAEEYAVAFQLDFASFDTYDKKLKTKQLLGLGKKLLSKYKATR